MADKHDVQLDIIATTSGSESIRTLAADVSKLAKGGGDAAPELQRLADSLGRLADQADSVQSLSALEAEIAQLGVAHTGAAEKVAAHKAQLELLAAAALQTAAAEREALAAVKGAQADLNAQGDALKALRLEYDASGKRAADYRVRVEELGKAELAANVALREKKETLKEASAAANAAEAAEKSYARTLSASERAAKQVADQVKQQSAAYTTLAASLDVTGAATGDLKLAQQQLLQTFVSTRDAIEETRAVHRSAANERERLNAIVANSERELARLAQQQLAAERQAISEGVALTQQLAAAQSAAAKQRARDIAEEDALLARVEAGKRAAFARGQQDLAAESRAQADNLALLRRHEADKAAAVTQAAAKIREEAVRSAKTLDDAFVGTGVRSARAIHDEINTIGAALVRLQNNTKVSGAEFDRAFASGTARIERLKQEMATVPGHIDKATKSTNLLGEGFRNLTAIYGGLELATSFIDSNVKMEALRRTLTLVTGSSEAAAKQIEFLKKTAVESGVSINAVAQSYAKFVASASAAGISLATVDSAFAAVTKAAGILGLSSEDTSSALNALAQSASKGKVSLEELQQQLGDRLPAVMATTAKGLGITTAELVKLVETGHLLADEQFFAAFAKGVNETFVKGGGEIKGFAAELGRLKNSFNDIFVALGDAGVISALTSAMSGISAVIRPLGGLFIDLGKGVGTVAAAIVDLSVKLVTLDFSGLKNGLRNANDEMLELSASIAKHIPENLKQLNMFGLGSFKAAEDIKKLKDETAKNTTSQAAAAATAKTVAAATAEAGAKAAAAGAQAAGATDNWVKLTVQFNTLIEKSKTAAVALEKVAEARKLEAAGMVALAEIGGNEIQIRAAQSIAADVNRAALEAVASARETESNLVKFQINALRNEATERGTLTEARKKELESMTLKLAGLEAETAKSLAAAGAAKNEALAKELVIATNKDNSASLDALKVAYESAARAAEQARVAEAAGKGTKEQSAAANRELARAQALYNDALNDAVKALDRKAERQRIDASLTQAKLGLERSALQTQIQIAEMDGNFALALDLKIRLKQNEVAIISAKITAAKLEAQASIAVVEATRAELIATGKLTEAKKLEIDAALANAKVKQIEAQASEETLKLLQRQIDNLRIYGDEAGAARNKSSTALDGETAALDRNTVSQRQNAAAAELTGTSRAVGIPSIKNRNAQLTSEIADGDAARRDLNRQAGDNTGAFSLQQKRQNGTLTADDLALAQGAYDAAKHNLTLSQDHGGSFSNAGANDALAQFNGARAALEKVLELVNQKAAGGTGRSGSTLAGSKTVNINLNGRTTSVAVTSQQDADALVAMLRGLESAQGRSGP